MNSLDPIYWRVVKYYELKKQIRKGLEVPYVVAYIRPYLKSYLDMNCNDRVDIDIQTAINGKYPGAKPQTILMDTEVTLNLVRTIASGIHYNALIRFVDDGINTFDGVKFYRYPAKIEQLLSLYVQDEQFAKYLSNELCSQFVLQGGGIVDYQIEEYNCKCQKLAFHPLFNPALIYVGKNGNSRKLLFYNLSKRWDETVILYVDDLGVGEDVKVLLGDDTSARAEMSWLIIEATDISKFHRIGTSGNDTQLYINAKQLFRRLFGDYDDKRVIDALSSLDKFEEI